MKYIYETINNFERNEQRDILSILENSVKPNRSLDEIYKYSEVTKDNTKCLIIQPNKIKPYYQEILIDDLSAEGQKFLFCILETNGCSSGIKELLCIGVCVQKDIRKYLKDKEYEKILKEIKHHSFKSSKKKLKHFKMFNVFGTSEKDGDYGIKRLNSNSNSDSIHIFVNGFTNDKKGNNFEEWEKKSKELFSSKEALYGYDWPSGKAVAFLKIIGKALVKRKIPVLAVPEALVSFVSEWKQARNYAEEYGHELSKFINKEYKQNPQLKIHLYGHSLGARLVYFALDNIDSDITIEEVFFFGGAVHIDEISATDILRSVKNVYNFYSSNDDILGYIYKTAEIGEEPIGLYEIRSKASKNNIGKIYNFNVSEFIDGHTKYTANFDVLYNRKYRKEEYT